MPAEQTGPDAGAIDHAGATPADADIARIILDLARSRGAAKSICPSEAARAVAAELGVTDAGVTEAGAAWRRFMKPVRRMAIRLAHEGRIEILRKGKPVPPPVPPDDIRGVIRLRIVKDHRGHGA